jgi:hypothetical protein
MLDMSMDEMCMGIFDNETNNKKSIVRSWIFSTFYIKKYSK